MSDRNNSDYYNFDNYDESIDIREYRRRQPDRRNNRNTTMNGRPPYNKRRPSKRRMRARTRNRIIMVATGVLAITLVIVLLVLMIRSCNPGGSSTNASTETKPAETKTESNNTQNTGATGFHHSGAVSNGKGTPLHFYAQGQTTVGYNWKYEGGEYLVDVGCDYNFSTHTYDFSLIGLRPGSSTITVYHYTDDNTKVPTVINFTVDENLNVTYR